MDETTLTRTLQDLAAGPPLHTAPAADARQRARRLQHRHRGLALTAVVVLAAGAFGVRGLAGGGTRHTTTATAPAHVLKIEQVTAAAACGSGLPGGDGTYKDSAGKECYTLAPQPLTIRPKGAQALYDGTQGYFVQVSLDDADAQAFGALTARVTPLAEPQNQLAIVLDGVVLSAPSIQEAILGGVFQITGGVGTPFTKADVDQLAAELRG